VYFAAFELAAAAGEGRIIGSILNKNTLEIQIDRYCTARDTASTPPDADECSYVVFEAMQSPS
jgi:hypothetical protein